MNVGPKSDEKIFFRCHENSRIFIVCNKRILVAYEIITTKFNEDEKEDTS